MKRWKFGRGQTSKQERKEMADAMEDGRAEEYLRGQMYAQMIDAELERRRAVKAERRRAA